MRPLIAAMLIALFAAGGASARAQSGGLVNEDLDSRSDARIAGAIITLGGSADRDLWVAGADLDIATEVGEDLWAAGANVAVRGDVGGDLRAAGANVRVRSEIEEGTLSGATVEFHGLARSDLQAFGARVLVGEGALVARDSELVAAVVEVNGEIDRDLQVAAEEFALNGRVGGDAEILAERMRLGPDARIEGDLDFTGPEAPQIPDGVVQGRVTTRIQDFRFEDRRTGEFLGLDASEIVGRVATALSALIAGLVVAALFPGAVSRVSARGRRRPFLSVLTGLGALIVTPILAVLLIVLVIGLPFGVAALLAYPFFLFLGYVFGAFILGSALSRRKGEAGFGAHAVSLLIALAIAFVVGFIPIAGGLLGLALLSIGLGAITMALFSGGDAAEAA